MFDKAEQRSNELAKNYQLLDTWKRRGDDLLYSMIPKTVADRLRTSDSALYTCEVDKFAYISSRNIKIKCNIVGIRMCEYFVL